MQEFTEERMRKAEEALVDYVAGRLEKDIGNPDEEISEVFAEIAPRTTGKGQIGNFASSIRYSLDLEAILGEVNTWSELAAEKLIEKRFEEEQPSKEKVANILKKRVYDRVAEIARQTPEHLQDMPYHLFLMLPGILGAKTKNPTGGITGIIGALIEHVESPKKEFKPKLGKRIGASIAGLQDYANLTLQQIDAAKSTESKSLLAYLRTPHPHLKDYGKFMQNERAMEVVSALDEKLSYSDALYLDGDGVETKKQLGKFISSFINDSTGFHERVFDERCSEMAKIIEDSDETDLELIEKLAKYRKEAPEDFYKSEILAGKSPAVEALGGDFIRSEIRENGLCASVRTSEDDPLKGAKTFVNVLAEFRSAGFGDKVHEYLARMLATHKNPVAAAWRYAAYLGIHGGDQGCLEGMEPESGEVKSAFMDALCKNAEKRVNRLERFEGYLRSIVFSAKSDEQKLEVIQKAKQGVEAGTTLTNISDRSLAEEFLSQFGLPESDFREYVSRVTDGIDFFRTMGGGYGSLAVVDLGGEAIKVTTAEKAAREKKVYRLLEGTRTAKRVTQFMDSKSNEDIGLIKLGKFRGGSAVSIESLIRNPSRPAMDAYIRKNIREMALLHFELTSKAEKAGEYDDFTHEMDYNSNSNPNFEMMRDPMQNVRVYGHFTDTMPSLDVIRSAKKVAKDVKKVIKNSKTLIHGDWKPENNDLFLHDFSDVRKGHELEDVMRFLTSYFVQCSQEDARDYAEEYIKIRSEVDEDFQKDSEKHKEIMDYANHFYVFEAGLHALRANKRDLRDDNLREQRIFYINNLSAVA